MYIYIYRATLKTEIKMFYCPLQRERALFFGGIKMADKKLKPREQAFIITFEKLFNPELSVEEIVALKQNVQGVVLTNFGQSAYAMELVEAGAFDFVPKPWNNEKLLVTLRNAFQMRQLSNALRQAGRMDGDMESDEERSGMSSEMEKGKERILTLEQMEKKMMKAAIKRNRGNISLAAEQLGVTRQTLYNKGKKYKLFE